MENPDDLRYSKEHEWVRLDGDKATVGITDHAQHQLTDIVFVELPEKGKKVEQNGNLAVVESVKSVSDVFSPIAGEVIEVNESLKDKPELINKAPYSEGWIARIKVIDAKQSESLMSAEEYDEYVNKEDD